MLIIAANLIVFARRCDASYYQIGQHQRGAAGLFNVLFHRPTTANQMKQQHATHKYSFTDTYSEIRIARTYIVPPPHIKQWIGWSQDTA